jgi:hypothetical protein
MITSRQLTPNRQATGTAATTASSGTMMNRLITSRSVTVLGSGSISGSGMVRVAGAGAALGYDGPAEWHADCAAVTGLILRCDADAPVPGHGRT